MVCESQQELKALWEEGREESRDPYKGSTELGPRWGRLGVTQ